MVKKVFLLTQHHKKVLSYLLLTALSVFSCWFFVGRYSVFGAKVDWLSQHSAIPDYFRRQFYETGRLFPEFAPALGGGQNIYHFSYYGLYSPILLFSYLLPFVKMGDYLIAADILGLAASVLLFFYWLETQGFSRKICFFTALMFLLAAPMVYQYSHQIMFVNYMPFLLMALIGADRYWEKKKTGLLILGAFLMIMTSFYFSVGGLLVLFLYGISRCPHRDWFRGMLFYLLSLLAAIGSSSVLLLPTALALFTGEDRATDAGPQITSLLLPNFNPARFFYNSYSIGLPTLALTVLLIGLTYRSRKEKLLSAGCLLVLVLPVFPWVLNGGLYVRDKALIPFLPLLCYLIAVYLQKQAHNEIPFYAGFYGHLLMVLVCLFYYYKAPDGGNHDQKMFLILAESLLMFICFLLFFRHYLLLILPPILCLLLFNSAFYNINKHALEKSLYEQVTDPAIGDEISAVLEEETGLYRMEQAGSITEMEANLNRVWDTRQWITSLYSSTYNQDYQKFRKNVFNVEEPFRNDMMQASSQNPLFQKMMGVKYIVGRTDSGDIYTLENAYAAPVIFATDQTISLTDYNMLGFPYNQTALMHYAVTGETEETTALRQPDDHWRQKIADTAAPAKISLPYKHSEGAVILPQNNGYLIQTKKKLKVPLRIYCEKSTESRLLFLRFTVTNRNPQQDISIYLEGMRNKLSADYIYYNENTSFTYVTELSAGKSEVEISLGKGNYEISEIQCYLGSAALLQEETLYQSELDPDWAKTKGNRISGEITVKEAGYLVTSIPFDKGFQIQIDGQPAECEKVNTAFLGCRIQPGVHQIDIIYHAPGLAAGKLLSCIGFLLWLLLFLLPNSRFSASLPALDDSVH